MNTFHSIERFVVVNVTGAVEGAAVRLALGVLADEGLPPMDSVLRNG